MNFKKLCTIMAPSIPKACPSHPGICHLVGPSEGDLSENLCPGVGHLSILLEAVKVVPFSSLENIPI